MKHLLFLFTVMALLSSCSEKDPIDNEKGIFQVNCFYTTENNPTVKTPDAQSKVFIYYGHNSLNYAYFSYEGEGRLVNGDSNILPDQTATIEADGTVVIQLEQVEKSFNFLVESNYYRKISSGSFPKRATYDKIVSTVIFNP